MEFQFQVAGADIVALREFCKRQPSGRRYRALQFVRLLLLCAITVLLIFGRPLGALPPPWRVLVVALSGLALCVPLWALIDARSSGLHVDYNQRRLGLETYTVTEDGLSNVTPIGSVSHKWDAVDRIDETAKYVFIFAQHYVYVWPKQQAPDAIRQAAEIARAYHAATAPPKGTDASASIIASFAAVRFSSLRTPRRVK